MFAVTANAQQAQVAGRIVAAKVKGTVTATNTVDNTKRELHDSDAITEKYVVTTAQNSSVILVFSNGSTINLAQDSTLSIEQFLQDPFSTSYAMATATAEPSTSTTKLTLSRGELVGNVKHLNNAAGSTFTVNTPVGAAGIRGTTFRIVFRPDSSGKAFFTLSTAEGEVILTGTTAQQLPVGTGKEVTVTVDVAIDAAGNVTLTSPPVVTGQDISPANQVTIAAAAADIATTSGAIVFPTSTTSITTPPPPAPPAPGPDVQQQKPQTTSGDGKG
ncbi:MAG: hypothetical protein JWM35_1178 [Verrucomicrobia bacterium]|nr:hypothetical protein [Verrucomicrobiota bacterium]